MHVPVFKARMGTRNWAITWELLSSTFGKVFERVINIRIRVVAEEVVMKEPKEVSERQKLCGPDLGTEKCSRTEGLKRVIAFLDVKKVYDTSTVWREGLWRNNRIAEKLVNGASCSTRVQIEAVEVTGRGSTE